MTISRVEPTRYERVLRFRVPTDNTVLCVYRDACKGTLALRTYLCAPRVRSHFYARRCVAIAATPYIYIYYMYVCPSSWNRNHDYPAASETSLAATMFRIKTPKFFLAILEFFSPDPDIEIEANDVNASVQRT